ncbi:MAG: hypothetical protein H7249_17705 [Chitinophagaceae bacterium]|nr:hypothetical protein [Oligoflexus sp.]
MKLSASTREGRIFKFNVKWQLRDPSKPVPIYVPVKPFTQEFPVEAGGELLNAKYAAQQYFKSVVHKSHEFILSYSEQVFYQRVGKFVFQVLRKAQGEESLYVLKYRHDLLAEDDKKSLRIFTSLDEAKAVFDSLVGQQETSPFERWQDRIEDAQKIKKRMLPGGECKV